MDRLLIAVVIVAVIGGGAILFMALRLGGKAKKAQEDLALRNGWSYDFSRLRGGSGSETVFSDPRQGWTLTLYRSQSRSSSGSGGSTRWTQFEDAGVPVSSGMAVLGPEIPAQTAAMADKMLGMMGGDIGKWMLDKITGGLGDEAQGLRTVEGDGAGHLMASPGAEAALDPVRGSPELARARDGKTEMRQPIVMRGPFGLRLRVSQLVKKPEDIEAFIRLGKALSAGLR